MNAGTPLNPGPPTTCSSIFLQDQPVCDCSTLITPFPRMIFWVISCICNELAWPWHELNIFLPSRKGEDKKQDQAMSSSRMTAGQKRGLSQYFHWVLYLLRVPSGNTQLSKEATSQTAIHPSISWAPTWKRRLLCKTQLSLFPARKRKMRKDSIFSSAMWTDVNFYSERDRNEKLEHLPLKRKSQQ